MTTTRGALLLLLLLSAPAAAQVPAPEAFFGFRMGADTQLASWPRIVEYFEAVARASDRVELVDAGPTTDGNRLVGAIVSSPANVARLESIKAANRRLADPKLEALRRMAVLTWHHSYSVPKVELQAFFAAGFTTDHYELLGKRIAEVHVGRLFRGAR